MPEMEGQVESVRINVSAYESSLLSLVRAMDSSAQRALLRVAQGLASVSEKRQKRIAKS